MEFALPATILVAAALVIIGLRYVSLRDDERRSGMSAQQLSKEDAQDWWDRQY